MENLSQKYKNKMKIMKWKITLDLVLNPRTALVSKPTVHGGRNGVLLSKKLSIVASFASHSPATTSQKRGGASNMVKG